VFGYLPDPLPRLATSCVPVIPGYGKYMHQCVGGPSTVETRGPFGLSVCVHVVQTQILSQLPCEDCIRHMGTGCEAFCPGYCVSQGMSDVYFDLVEVTRLRERKCLWSNH